MDALWHVAHTRPRCEKKVAEFCAREGLEHVLPLFRSLKRYRGKRLVFHKPLFPGYVFLRIQAGRRESVRQQAHVANLLEPPDQAEFAAQLAAILLALESGGEVRLAPEIAEGQRVRIRQGPLRGIEGVVTRRQGVLELVLSLDFIGQAAAVQVLADEVEPA